MKTTLNIDDSVMQRLREEAARRRTTVSALVEAGLRHVLAPEVTASELDDLPPLPTWDSGGHLVDIDDRDALDQAMVEGTASVVSAPATSPSSGSRSRPFWIHSETGAGA